MVMRAGARAEWHPLRHVMVHEPGIEVFFALLSPTAHLYERFFNLSQARSEHRQLAAMLHDTYGVRVSRLRDVVVERAAENRDFFANLADLAAQRLSWRCIGEACDLPPRIRRELEQPFALAERDPDHLLDIVILNPAVVHTKDRIFAELAAPLYNLYFMRDQQAATDRGLVQSRMASPQRYPETDLCELALSAVEARPVHRVQKGRFEGGDFIPAGDWALIGLGSRTSRAGIEELLASALSFDEVAVVRQPHHPLVGGHDPMIAMHLDTYFNIAADGVAVANPLLLQNATVEIYRRTGQDYEKSGVETTLDAYIREKEFSVVEVTTLEQLCYASNFLCVRNGQCICPDTAQIAPEVLERLREKATGNPRKYAPLLAQAERDFAMLRREAEFFPHKQAVYAHGLEMNTVHLTHATGGYGGAHCMTCVLRRG